MLANIVYVGRKKTGEMRLGKRLTMKSYPSPTEEGADKAGEDKARGWGDGLIALREASRERSLSSNLTPGWVLNFFPETAEWE